MRRFTPRLIPLLVVCAMMIGTAALAAAPTADGFAWREAVVLVVEQQKAADEGVVEERAQPAPPAIVLFEAARARLERAVRLYLRHCALLR